MTDSTIKTGQAAALAQQDKQTRPAPKWAARIEDQLVLSPGRKVKVLVLKEQASIAPSNVLVRDYDGEADVALKDDDVIDLAEGNVFYVVPKDEAPTGCGTHKGPKLAFFVDDRPEETFLAEQTGKTLRDLFSFTPDVLLFRDYESPLDEPIGLDDKVNFGDGCVFYTRRKHKTLKIFVNDKPFDEDDGVKPKMNGEEIAKLVFDDPQNYDVYKLPGDVEIKAKETIDIHDCEKFKVIRKTVTGGYEQARIERELDLLRQSGATVTFVPEVPGVVYHAIPTRKGYPLLQATDDRVENAAIAAMARSNTKESAVNNLLYRLGSEIVYPIELPTVSLLSQNYFYINTDFQLMCIPLMELHFLLHLPDIYHELAHPLFLTENDPRTKAWLNAFRRIQLLISNHFTKQIVELEAARTTDTIRVGVADSYQNWQCRWAEEFFCDLFGLFSVGPAYAWSHLHLHAERGRNAYQLPRRFSTHPADSPRMAIMLDALSLLNQGAAASQIESKWKGLLAVAAQSEPQEYHRYYPRPLLKKCVEEAFEGFTDMGCKPWAVGNERTVRNTLNEAWNRFWTAPQSFAAWEKEVTEALLPL